jgi:hypothetical protein
MKKNLKQSSLFERLKYHKVTVKQYVILYVQYTQNNVTDESKDILGGRLWDFENNEFTPFALKVLEHIDELFATKKKLKLDDLMGQDYQNQIDDFIDIFPTTKLPNGKYARGNKKNIETNFRWFFENYNYSWQVIHDATLMYVSEYRAKNFLYMRTALYFIRKDDGTRTVHSDLADYCDKIVNNESYTKEKYFKTKIL